MTTTTIDHRTRVIHGKLVSSRIEAERLVLDMLPDGVPDDIRALCDQIVQAQEALARVKAVRS